MPTTTPLQDLLAAIARLDRARDTITADTLPEHVEAGLQLLGILGATQGVRTADDARRRLAHAEWMRANASLVLMQEAAGEEWRARRAAPCLAVLDRETAHETASFYDPEAEACVEVSCPRESQVPAAPQTVAKVDEAFGEFNATLVTAALQSTVLANLQRAAEAARVGAETSAAVTAKKRTGFRLLAERAPERLREVASKGGRACAERRRSAKGEAA
jgi:hypothetical protein